MATQTFIKTNSEGKPWTAVRKVTGKSIIVTKILSGDTYVEVPAAMALAMVNGPAKKPAVKTTIRQTETAKSLLEITNRYAFGKVR